MQNATKRTRLASQPKPKLVTKQEPMTKSSPNPFIVWLINFGDNPNEILRLAREMNTASKDELETLAGAASDPAWPSRNDYVLIATATTLQMATEVKRQFSAAGAQTWIQLPTVRNDKEPSEIPEWVTLTADEPPDEHSPYTLFQWQNSYVPDGHEIILTRSEFITLKKVLAAMRGYKLPDSDDVMRSNDVMRYENIATILDPEQIDFDDVMDLRRILRICSVREDGDVTPIENFILHDLPEHYVIEHFRKNRGITPEEIVAMVQGNLASDFECAIETARFFNEWHPDAVASPVSATP